MNAPVINFNEVIENIKILKYKFKIKIFMP